MENATSTKDRHRARARNRFIYATTALAAIPALHVPVAASADTKSWNGTLNDDWTETGNWTGGSPAPTDEAVIDTTANAPVLDGGETVEAARVVIGDAASATLTVRGNATLDVSGEVVIANRPGSVGTLAIGSGGAAGTVSAPGLRFGEGAGKIVFDHNQVIDFGSDISGAGSLEVLAGTTRLTGTNSYTGGTTVSGGVLTGDTDSLTGDIVNNATLVFEQVEDGEFAGTITGFGGVRKTGSGNLTLSGSHGYTGATRLVEGELVLAGSHASFVLMSTETALAVGGTLNNSVIGLGTTVVNILEGGRIDSRDGTHAVSVENDSYVLNAGTISARNDTLYAIGMYGSGNALVNAGTITADTETAVRTNGTGNVVLNTGLIEVTGSTTVAVRLGPDEDGSSDQSLVANTGTVLSLQGNAVVMETYAGSEGVAANAGTIETRAGDAFFAFLSGDGDETLLNAGTIIGNVDMGGGDDTVILNPGAVFRNSFVDGGTGTNLLVLGGEGTGADGGRFDLDGVGDTAVFSGFYRMEKQDGGDWTLSGSAAGTGLGILEGKASVQGVIGAVTVSGTGRLEGTGTLASLDAQPGSTVAPGNSIGTLTVTGDVTFAADSIYEVEVNAAGDGDRITAGGAADIDPGARVSVLTESGRYAPSTTYTILTAAGGVTGQFGPVTSSSAFLVPVLGYDPNTVFLTLTRNDTALTDIARTRNQLATATAATALGGEPLVDAILGQSADGARAAFDALSGEIHASVKGMLVDDGRILREAAIGRVRAATDGGAVWSHAFGASGRRDGDGNAARFDRSTGGFLLGGDAPVADDWRLGLMIGYGRTDFDVEGRASRGSGDSYHLGAYGGWRQDGWGLRFGAAHSWHEIDTSRTIAVGGFGDSARTGYDAGMAQAFAELGRRIDAGAVAIEPFGSLAYAHLRMDGFTESGGTAALTSGSSTLDATFTTLGLRAGMGFDLGGTEAALQAGVAWRHVVGDVTPHSGMAFVGGNPFTVEGVPIARDAGVAEVGLTLALAPGAGLGVAYGGQFGTDGFDQNVRASLAVRF